MSCSSFSAELYRILSFYNPTRGPHLLRYTGPMKREELRETHGLS